MLLSVKNGGELYEMKMEGAVKRTCPLEDEDRFFRLLNDQYDVEMGSGRSC